MKTLAQITAVLLAACVAMTWQAFAGDKEEKVKLEDCPAAVQKTIKDKAGTGKIVEVEKETRKDGSVVYEAEIKTTDGKELEITVAADGTLLKEEVDDDDDDDDDDDAKN